MTTTELQRTNAELGTTSYRAAVVHDFAEPLRVEDVPRRPLEPGQIRVRIEATGLCHTDIHAAHGDWPVKPSPPFVPRPRRCRDRRGARLRRRRGRPRRPGRAALARLRVRDVRLLRVRLGDALPRAEEHGLLDRRRLRRVRDCVRAVRRQGARRRRPVRRGAAHLRRRHDVQGDQGRRHTVVRTSSPSSASAGSGTWRSSTPYRRRPGRRGRSARREARARTGARRRVHGERGRGGPGRRHPEAGRRRPGDRAGGLARSRSSRRIARCAGVGRSCSSRLPAENDMTLPIFETVLNGITVVGSIVGTTRGPARGLRAARSRKDDGHT